MTNNSMLTYCVHPPLISSIMSTDQQKGADVMDEERERLIALIIKMLEDAPTAVLHRIALILQRGK